VSGPYSTAAGTLDHVHVILLMAVDSHLMCGMERSTRYQKFRHIASLDGSTVISCCAAGPLCRADSHWPFRIIR